MRNKKPTSYIILGLAIAPIVLSVLLWVFIYATRKPYDPEERYGGYMVEVEEPTYQDVDKAVIYLGDNRWYEYLNKFDFDSCSVDGSFYADTLVIISTNKSIQVKKYD